MILGLFFSPVISGCFMLLLIFMVLAGILIFFSLNFIWFLFAGLFIYTAGLVHKYIKWKKLPNLTQYLSKYPECKLNVGVACCKCNSEHLLNQGLFNQRGRWRFYTCQRCGSILFRFTIL